MKHGLAVFSTDRGMPPDELARLAEERGFESLWLPEHTHFPAEQPGSERPPQYRRTYDPFVALTAAAAATRELLLGTGVCLVVEREPIATAKAVASLDHLSGGRFLFGIGAGWNRQEMRNHGTDPRTRFALMQERVEAMKAIWTEEEASYSGEFVEFERIWSWPKPAQRPHPPVMVGGNGPKVLDRVIAYGDEWLPEPEDGLTDRMRELPERARAAGRDPIPITVFGAEPEDVGAYAEAGAHRCVHWLPPWEPEDTARRVEELAAAIGS